jgi:hypothetical protein
MKLIKTGEARFAEDMTYLPITMLQFESLTNEILTEINKLTDPSALGGDYAAQIVMEAIRALDRNKAYVSKTDLFEASVNLISRHVSFYAVEQIKARLEASKAAAPKDEADDGSTSL